ncbi:MAG: hypothetical protein SynsKO_12870 [Synoicihabitans sp.]
MRINIIQGAFLPVPPLRGGAVEKMWHRMGIEFAREGHKVTHLSRIYSSLPTEEQRAGVSHLRVTGYDQPHNGLWLKLLDYFYSRRALAVAPPADVTITNTFWAPILSKPHHGKLVVDVQRMPKGQLRFYDHAARLRANSSAVSEAMIRERPSTRGRIQIIPNPLTSPPEPSKPWSERAKTILYAGRIHPEKGLEMLLAAWQRIRKSEVYPGWKLKLIGPSEVSGGGGGERWWSQTQARYGAEGIEILSPIYDESSLNTHYATARIFVYPSLAETGETFGSAILEAMSHGTPPVVSALACFTDFVQHNRNGFVFNHRDADRVSQLETVLKSSMVSDLSLQSHDATRVNETHSPTAISRAFLSDFNALTTHP